MNRLSSGATRGKTRTSGKKPSVRQLDPGKAGITPKRQRYGSIRLIITMTTVMLISLSVIGVGWVAERNARDALTAEIEARLLLEARNLASLSVDALLSDYPELTLCPVVTEMQAERPDLAFMVVLDHKGRIQGHVDLRVLGTEFDIQKKFGAFSTSSQLKSEALIQTNRELLVASVPAIYANGQEVGTAIVGMRKAYLEQILANSRQEMVMITAVLLLLGIVCALVLMSVLLRPVAALRKGLERIGRGDLDTPLDLKDRTELGQLADTVNGMASQLKASQLEMMEKERLGHEMDLAHTLQQSLLPGGPTRLGRFVVDGSYRAAAEVGGDYYDVFELADGRLGLVIADVAGKGLAGCLVSSMLAVLIRSLRNTCSSPKALLLALEENLSDTLRPGTFVTIFYGILDPAKGRLVFASAAHSPLLIYRVEGGHVEAIHTKGIPLGAVRGGALATTLQDEFVDLAPGDLAIQYTDGLNEAWNRERDEEFGIERLAAIVAEKAAEGSSAVLSGLQEAVNNWSEPDPPGDDQTLLVIGGQVQQSSDSPNVCDHLGTRVSLLSPREQLEEMLGGAPHLAMPTNLNELDRLHEWVERSFATQKLRAKDKHLIESSLYELCANIIEHGCQNDPDMVIDLWWLPSGSPLMPIPVPSEVAGSIPAHKKAEGHLGYFLVCDQGTAFNPNGHEAPDYHDPQVRLRGRGLGLHIVQSSMEKIVYVPDTPSGNLTLLRFDPAKHVNSEELTNV